jgi:hypothetical protein
MDRMMYFYIGVVPMFIVFMLISDKKLRNSKSLNIAALLTFPFALLGFWLTIPEAAMFAGAFVYVAGYACLRFLFKKIYNIEPTYNRGAWYDAEEGRKQNWFDVVVFILPLMSSMVVPIALVALKSKHII